MNKYELTENGVKDLETGENMPESLGNRHWQEYQNWLAKGNTPRPIKPNQYCTWDDMTEEWVEDAAAKERTEAQALLESTDKDVARITEDLIAVLISNGAMALGDLPQSARDKLVARAAARQVLPN